MRMIVVLSVTQLRYYRRSLPLPRFLPPETPDNHAKITLDQRRACQRFGENHPIPSQACRKARGTCRVSRDPLRLDSSLTLTIPVASIPFLSPWHRRRRSWHIKWHFDFSTPPRHRLSRLHRFNLRLLLSTHIPTRHCVTAQYNYSPSLPLGTAGSKTSWWMDVTKLPGLPEWMTQ